LSIGSLYANIDARIDAIQKAPIEERFILMNQFKQEISHMNEAARIDAITKLKSITQSEHSQKAINELKHRVRQSYVKQICKTKRNQERCEKDEILRHHKYENEMEVDFENETENQAEEGIENETEESIENQTEESIENETEESIENETEESIENETEESIENQTEESIENETEESIENETEESIEDEHDDDD